MEWIVVANRVKAKIYNLSKNRLKLIREHKNPIGRLKDRELRHDQPGQSRAKYIGSAPHRLSKETSPHEEAADQFANQLSKLLKFDLKKRESLKLKFVAEARFLGKIKGHFKESLFKSRIEWIEKNLERVPQEKLPKIIGLKVASRPTEIGSRFLI